MKVGRHSWQHPARHGLCGQHGAGPGHLTWLGGVGWRHLVVHHGVRRGLLVGQEALVSRRAQRVQPRPGVLVGLLSVLAVLLLHLLPGAELSVLQLLHVEVLALRQQLLPLLLQCLLLSVHNGFQLLEMAKLYLQLLHLRFHQESNQGLDFSFFHCC